MAIANITLGSGEVWFDRFDDSYERGERYIASTTSFLLTPDVETIEHFDPDHGHKVKDESVTVRANWNGTFVTEDIDWENMSLFFAGRPKTITTAAVPAGVSTFTKINRGLTYQIGVTDVNVSGTRKLTSVVAKKGTTVLVEGTDYTVDLVLGRIRILPTSTGIAKGDDLTVEYVAPAQVRNQVISGREPVSGALRFISYNAVGRKVDYYMPMVKLSANGDYELKGETWQQMSFNIEVLKRDDTTEMLYIDGRPS